MEPKSRRKKSKVSKYCSSKYLQGYWGDHGGYSSIPRRVILSDDFKSLSHAARSILFVLLCQYNGKNNGDLTTALSVLETHGLRSPDTNHRCTEQLVEKGIIVKTRQGRGGTSGYGVASLYALSWLPVDEININVAGSWEQKIKGTRNALRTDFSKPCDGPISYEHN